VLIGLIRLLSLAVCLVNHLHFVISNILLSLLKDNFIHLPCSVNAVISGHLGSKKQRVIFRNLC
jgi:hypothetical protein